MEKKRMKSPMAHARLAAASLLFALCANATAQQMGMNDVFRQMPDSLLPTMSKNNRLDMVDFIDSGMKATITDNLDGQCTMDTLTANYAHISMGGSMTVELKLLPSTNELADSSRQVVCMVKTFGSEAKESTVSFYTEKWTPLPITLSPAEYAETLCTRPDTMSAERYAGISPENELVLVAATLSPNDNTLTLTPQMPLQTEDEEKDMTAIMRSITMAWTGKLFIKE